MKQTGAAIGQVLAGIGEAAITFFAYAGALALLAGQTLVWLFRPHTKHRRLVRHLLQIGVRTLPVSGVIIFLVGMVITFQTAYQMRALGGEILIPGLLAVSIARELGPVMTAFVLAGRVGAAITAELGTMAVTEQIDAIDAMSVPPVKYLVVPRFLAMAIAAPILTVYTDVIGILGGYVVCVWKLGMSPYYFFDSVFDAMQYGDFSTGLIKAVIFGMVVCIVACYEGMKVAGGAEGVGKSTMQSVVVSFILVVLADFIFTVYFYFLPL